MKGCSFWLQFVRMGGGGGGVIRYIATEVWLNLKIWVKQLSINVGCIRVPTPQGKQGKWQKKIPVRENTGNLEILPKHREFGLLKL